ncbi:hypothetical protein [Chitinimonas naiadis]
MLIPQEGQIFEATQGQPGYRISIVELKFFADDCFLVSYTEHGKEFDMSRPVIELDHQEWQALSEGLGLQHVSGDMLLERNMATAPASEPPR